VNSDWLLAYFYEIDKRWRSVQMSTHTAVNTGDGLGGMMIIAGIHYGTDLLCEIDLLG
jgi:hypothetical protein